MESGGAPGLVGGVVKNVIFLPRIVVIPVSVIFAGGCFLIRSAGFKGGGGACRLKTLRSTIELYGLLEVSSEVAALAPALKSTPAKTHISSFPPRFIVRIIAARGSNTTKNF